MALCIYLDGRFVNSREEARVSLFDHGLLYGDGVFEGIRVYHGRVFRMVEHLDRLERSARGIALEIPISREKLTEALLETVRRSGLDEAYIRLVVSRGPGDLGIDPRKCKKSAVYIITDKINVYPPEKYEKGLQIITASTRRSRPDTLNCQIKSLNYLNNILGLQEASRQGADEAIMLNDAGYVTEATADNVFAIQGDRLLTSPAWLGLLEGITRGVVMELAPRVGLRVEERPLVMQDIYTADEVFLTGTGAELVPVVQVDGRTIAGGKPGPHFRDLLREFRERTTWDGVLVNEEAVRKAAPARRVTPHTAEAIG
jgi:branched-chain amino acid aminotransferase